MEIEIHSKKENPLLDRTEVQFTVRHAGESTPNREIIRNELAEKLNVKKDNVVVDSIDSGFGVQESKGYAKVYKSVEKSKNWEREHILVRNKLVEKKAKEKKGKKTVVEKLVGKLEETAKPKEEKKPAEEKPEASPVEEPSEVEEEKSDDEAVKSEAKPKEPSVEKEQPAEQSTEGEKE
jgi:small subunit ribosomal protein S24e